MPRAHPVSELHSTDPFALSSAQLTRAQSRLLLVPLLLLFKPVPLLPRPPRALQESHPPRSAPAPMVKQSMATLSAANLIPTLAHTQVQMPSPLTWIVCLPVTLQPQPAVSHSPTLAVLRAVDPAPVTSRTAWVASPSLVATTMSPV